MGGFLDDFGAGPGEGVEGDELLVGCGVVVEAEL
jgi:hypothetical protein